MTEPQDGTDELRLKCPDCAELILAEAKVCKHCGYRLDGTSARAGDTGKSPGGAALLSLVIPGLGQAYVGEWWRGAAFFLAFGFATFVAFVLDLIGPGWLIGLIAMVDAYKGGRSLQGGARPRAVGRLGWAVLACSVALGTAGMLKAAHDDDVNAGPAEDVSPSVSDNRHNTDANGDVWPVRSKNDVEAIVRQAPSIASVQCEPLTRSGTTCSIITNEGESGLVDATFDSSGEIQLDVR